MELSVCLDPRRSWADQRAVAVAAEAAGYAGVWVCDHFMPLPGDDRPVHEGWTTLTALAAATDRLRLGTLVLGAGYRHPAVVASMAATLDHVSGGRVVLGLGAGWQENEHAAYGIPLLPPPARLAMFEEYVVAVRSLLRDPVTDLDGEHWTLRAATCEPKPVQPARSRCSWVAPGGSAPCASRPGSATSGTCGARPSASPRSARCSTSGAPRPAATPPRSGDSVARSSGRR